MFRSSSVVVRGSVVLALLACATAQGPVTSAAGIAGGGELGHPLSIRCLAYCYPQPSIACYRGPESDIKDYEARANELPIRSLDTDSLGEYVCQAYNGVAKPASLPGEVVTPRMPPPDPIVEFPDVPIFTAPVHTEIRAEQTTLSAGAELNLPCEVDGHPEPDVYWSKDSVPLQSGDRIQATSARLTVSSVTVNDSGVYGCNASNGHSQHSSTVQINVQVPVHTDIRAEQTTLSAGAELNLPCEVDGNPEPDVYWSKDGVPLQSGDRIQATSARLMVSSVTVNDSGVYGCNASNGHSEHSSTVQINVQAPVRTEIRLQQTTLSAGAELNLPCEVDGHPEPDVYWSKDGVPLQSGDRIQATSARLTVSSVTVSDSGVYCCNASNGHSQHSSTVQINVQAPVRTEIRAEQTTLSAGAELNLPCEVDGHPEPDVYWSKDGVPLQSGDRIQATSARLTVSSVTVNDSGVYVCNASNGHSQHSSTVQINVQAPEVGCGESEFGCCYDNETAASGPELQGCPCNATEFGCCPDGVTPSGNAELEGCVKPCNTSAYGCCPDGKTPAHGPGSEGCCLLYPYGCCPDNYKPADGPHLEGCGCQNARFGCCPDNVTIARGYNKEGCGCEHTEHGCCPDKHTEASGPGYEGCSCHTYQFGCCPDGITTAKGPILQGCDCRQSTHGCCGDGQTAAIGPDQDGCDCASSKYGCCPDGQTEAKGEKFSGCTDVPENEQAACALSTVQGPCHNYSSYWFFDTQYGGCSRFWYGGCEGNGNRFATKEECEDVCVRPPDKEVCRLPKSIGGCGDAYQRWYYDSDYEQCGQFQYTGCLGNANNFETREKCQKQCQPARNEDQCKQPIERGSCAGNFARWGFNAEAGRCEQFSWGGCEGNANRFSSEAACVLRCQPPGALQPECTLPQEAGNCTDKEPAWSFSETENRCLPFYYSGCGGNGNKFSDERSCAEACPSAFEREMCTLPAETGDCSNYRINWYFDTANQRCRQFYYGGCGGNGNNFESEELCRASCASAPPTTTTQRPAEAGSLTTTAVSGRSARTTQSSQTAR